MSVKVYVVMGSYGEYSDHVEWPVKAYLWRRDADAHVEACTREHRQFSVGYTLGGNDERDLREIIDDTMAENGWYSHNENSVEGRREHRRFRRALAKLGIDVPSDPFVRVDHLQRVSWYVMGPIELDADVKKGTKQ